MNSNNFAETGEIRLAEIVDQVRLRRRFEWLQLLPCRNNVFKRDALEVLLLNPLSFSQDTLEFAERMNPTAFVRSDAAEEMQIPLDVFDDIADADLLGCHGQLDSSSDSSDAADVPESAEQVDDFRDVMNRDPEECCDIGSFGALLPSRQVHQRAKSVIGLNSELHGLSLSGFESSLSFHKWNLSFRV